jgi:hypothetical protein
MYTPLVGPINIRFGKKRCTIDRGKPSGHIRIAARAFADLRDDIGVDQIIHSSMSHRKSRFRLRSIPSSGAEASKA